MKSIIKEINHFPIERELREMNRYDLNTAITRNGGINKFRKLLGYESLKKPNGYWTEKNVIIELNPIIEKLCHFPTQNELNEINRSDLLNGIRKNGGFPKIRKLMGYKAPERHVRWNEKIITDKLKILIDQCGHFPIHSELCNMNRSDLSSAITKHGGFNYFRQKLGYEFLQKPNGYWNDKIIIDELNLIINKLDYFPTQIKLNEMNKSSLLTAINKNGGINKFRKLMNYEVVKKSNGFWTEKTVINELNLIIKNTNHFPTTNELREINRNDLERAIYIYGGVNHFRKLMGYTISMQDKYGGELRLYIGKRGKNTELIVKQIIQEWLEIHNLPKLSCNVKLSPKNILEFVCDIGKTVGIDVTNTDTKNVITRKWHRKQYHKNLDELWIVVFNDTFIEEDYNTWNNQSPENVIIMTIDNFLENLDYSIDISLQNKIDKYKKCTFRSKQEYLN